MRGVMRLFVMAALLTAGASAHATLQHAATTVSDLRIEGSYGFIGMAGHIQNCGQRVWVDMTNPVSRAVYATAMLAFSTGKSVVIRADDTGTRVFGSCQLYDIVVVQ